MFNWLKRLVGSPSERTARQYQPLIDQINRLEPEFQSLTDEALQGKTAEFRQRIAEGTELEDLLPEAFATVREAARRVLGQRHYDVQLIGGIVLHQGKIAEMKTGEGKTLVATLPLYLNALTGKGCHLITVNDYLAKVGAGWMGPIYHFLGVSVGFIAHEYSALFDPEAIDPNASKDDPRLVHWRECSRREAYDADITYGTNNEFGFDYLRDNMALELERLVQSELSFGIVDEVDNILIDEARTPLIISGPAQKSSDLYRIVAEKVKGLKRSTVTEKEVKDGAKPNGDFMVEERTKSITLTEDGIERLERLLNIPQNASLYDQEYFELTHYVENALKAQFIYHRDKDYMVTADGEVIIVDEFTGRPMPGRRWSDGLHQAVEAKEHVLVKRENVTLATITFQNYFRMYEKLAGMTGTAYTDREEFGKIYNLDVVIIPTHREMIRKDLPDQIYRTEKAKFEAVVNEVKELYEQGRPVLIGTTSVETSEYLSKVLLHVGIKHDVLNAKFHEKEASIVAQAGRRFRTEDVKKELLEVNLIQEAEQKIAHCADSVRAELEQAEAARIEAELVKVGRASVVTVATNMAGRGTDILIGGNPDGFGNLADINKSADLISTAGLVDEILAAQNIPFAEATQEQLHAALEDARRITKWERLMIVAKGGLHIIGTERHESRRIDNQLRGRAGRQGDPGSSRFYLSLEDELMRRFGGERIKGLMDKLVGDEEDIPIEASMLDKAIESAQSRVEGYNFDVRKHTVEFDDVMNMQRKIVYSDRQAILEGQDMRERILEMMADEIGALVDEYAPEDSPELWNLEGLLRAARGINPLLPTSFRENDFETKTAAEIEDKLLDLIEDAYEERERALGPESMRFFEQRVMLGAIDRQWVEYLTAMDDLRQAIGLQAYAQRDPLVEFKRQSFEMFDELKANVSRDIAYQIIPKSFEYEAYLRQIQAEQQQRLEAAKQAGADEAQSKASRTVRHKFQLPGRNDICPCGSGKKFKNCHINNPEELEHLAEPMPQLTIALPANSGKRGRNTPSVPQQATKTSSKKKN